MPARLERMGVEVGMEGRQNFGLEFMLVFSGVYYLKRSSYHMSPRAQLLVVGMLRFLAHSFYAVLASASVSMAFSTVFHSMNSSDISPFSRSVLLVLFLPYGSFQLHISV